MTTTYERTRSTIQAREFLTELSLDTSQPNSVRSQAKQLLRHYPTRLEILRAGSMEEFLAENTIFQPVFSSSIEDG